MSLVDLTDVESSSGFEPMPKGDYLIRCEKAEVKETRDGTGQFISCEMSVMGPQEYEGRKVFTNFNIKNKSEQAVEIGLSQLKSFMECSKVDDPNKLEDVSALEGLICTAHLKIRKSEQYGDSNEVHYFKPGDDFSEPEKSGVDENEKLPF